MLNLNQVSDTSANLKLKAIDNFMSARYRDLVKNISVV